MIRDPFGHLSFISLRASRRPADERMSPSACTDQVTTPPAGVSRIIVASWPQPVREMLMMTTSEQTRCRAVTLRCCEATSFLPKRLRPRYGVLLQNVPSGRVLYPAPNDWKSAISRPSVAQICTQFAETVGRLRGRSSTKTTLDAFVVPTTITRLPRWRNCDSIGP